MKMLYYIRLFMYRSRYQKGFSVWRRPERAVQAGAIPETGRRAVREQETIRDGQEAPETIQEKVSQWIRQSEMKYG